MNAMNKCGTCGAVLNAAGLCPACLLNVGMATRTAQTTGSPAVQAAMARPEIGALFGQYRIARLLGRGGMGEVYEAEHTGTGRRVAVKVLNQAITSDADRKRFIREGSMAATVSDPHVVYVFGSEEIQGAPVIAMELATGGTLKDRVKKGQPLPPAEAVDDILQVIDGLDTAQAAGVLHRDIKPANCFVDSDGNVKVGDFGLSISTLGHMESQNLTAPGSLLGTPAFASPEQLRGSQLDMRADIYSVGATLYFLLTGKPPHEAETIVALITQVLDKPPESPRVSQPNISPSLAGVVMKCLAKDPKDRFANYGELRHALQPFCSTAPKPGMLGLRFVAGFVDSFFAVLPGIIYAMIVGVDLEHQWMTNPTLANLAPAGLLAVWTLLYYAFSENRWGATFGKWMCGLRVVGPDKQPPAFGRALLRAGIYVFVMQWGQYLLQFLTHSGEELKLMTQGTMMDFTMFCGLFLWAVLFVSIRRRNGFAGLHELATGTRVVAKMGRRQARPALHGVTASAPSRDGGTPSLHAELIGPYVVIAPLAQRTDGNVLLGRDEVLRRNVWIVQQPAGTPPLPPVRRDLARPGRVRWLNGARTATETWDAFEAPEGKPLTEICGSGFTPRKSGDKPPPTSWTAVRFWLLDLAVEISAGMKDGSLPPLVVENVFITAQGRAMLLDSSLVASPNGGTTNPTLPDVQKFLNDVVTAALGGEPHGLPLDVPPFLKNLRERSLHAMEFVVANLQSFTEKIPTVTHRRRMGSMFLAPACFAAIAIMTTVATVMKKDRPAGQTEADGPDIERMSMTFTVYAKFGTNNWDGMRDAAGTVIAGRFAKEVGDPKFWEMNSTFNVISLSLKTDVRAAAEDAVKRYANPTPEALAAAEAKMEESWKIQQEFQKASQPYVGLFIMLGGLMLIGAVNLLCSIIGFTPGLRLFGMAVVNRKGEKAGRGRLILRSLVAWAPFILMPFILPLAQKFGIQFAQLAMILALPWIFGIYLAIYFPSRGPHDRAAGTWLVPR